MTPEEWKSKSLPIGLRVLALEDKAQDSGLTELEKRELKTLDLIWSQLLKKFLDSEFPRSREPENAM